MNTRILLLVLGVAAFSSCASVYKTGQTPDDVYYSPGKPKEVNSYAEVRKQKEGTNYQTYEQYQDQMRDDRFLRMSVGNPYYMNGYDMYSGFDWRYNSYYDGFNYGLYSPWNSYFAWNNFYNPYSPFGYYNSFYGGGFYGGGGYYGSLTGSKSPLLTTASRPAVFNVNSYGSSNNANRPVSRNYVNNVNSGGSYYNNNGARYNNSNNYNNSNSGRSYYNNSGGNHPAYSPSSSGSSNTYTPSRSYTPSSGGGGGGSTGGGGGGGSAPSRPSRGN